MLACTTTSNPTFMPSTMRSYRPTHDALAGLVSQITMLSSEALEGLLSLVAQYEPSHVANCSYDEVELDLERLQPLTLMAVAQYVTVCQLR